MELFGRRIACASLAALAALALGACAQNAQTSNVDRVYTQMLANRLTQYNQTAAEMDAQVKAEFTGLTTTPVNSTATIGATDPNLPDEIASDAEIHARAAILTRFTREAAASGQIGLMSSWLQTQAQELQHYSRDTDSKVTAFQQAAAKNPKDPQLAPQVLGLLVERGSERGTAEELMTLSTDLEGYARDYGAAAAADEQQREQTVRLLAAYLSAPRVNVTSPVVQPTMMQPPMFTNCQAFLGGMNCITH